MEIMHARLWTIKFMLFCFHCSYNPRSCFSSNFLLLVFMIILHFVSLWYIFVFLLLCFFLCPAFFRVSLPFFFLILLHSLSFFKKIVFYLLVIFNNILQFFRLFIYVLPHIHENLIREGTFFLGGGGLGPQRGGS